MKQERIGIFGGTFHPIHNGHLLLAAHARDVLSLDRVLFVIDRIPPHKELDSGAETADRLKLLELALMDRPGFAVETMELRREGKSYSFDTLTDLKAREPDAKLYFLMGSDMLRSFDTWYRPDGIARLATLVCIERAGQAGSEAETAVALREKFGAEIILLDSVSELSSTEVRNRIEAALPIDGLVPDSVALEIYARGLYQPPEIRAMTGKLRGALTEKRMRHTAGVVMTALRLAAENGVDPKQTRIAALLHDCAKYLPKEELLRRSTDETPILPVLHSEAGAQLAAEQYGVTDPAILRAIRLHTTGDAGMTKLDKVVYLADMIEPGRDYPGVDALRSVSDLDAATLLALRRSLTHITERGFAVHPATLRAINDLGGSIDE
ncbi:MAG: nicotinate-nucleotide adenylyltransferase [Clostridia bacterium]|nr:nicotinate-nucleotide adenylyltransferase [Clostridia bacterium]